MSRTIIFLSLLAGASLLGLGSCGGAAPSESDTGPVTVTIGSTAALDGFVRSDGAFDTNGGSAAGTGDVDAVANGVGSRQFYSFDLSGIPQNATILSAFVTFQQTSCVGTPYTTHGSVRFEHVVYGPTLDAADYDVPTLHDEGGLIVSGNGQVSGRGLWVTASVAADVSGGSGLAQFRTKFQTFDSDSDDVSDYAHFTEAEDADPLARPTLEVTYQP